MTTFQILAEKSGRMSIESVSRSSKDANSVTVEIKEIILFQGWQEQIQPQNPAKYNLNPNFWDLVKHLVHYSIESLRADKIGNPGY